VRLIQLTYYPLATPLQYEKLIQYY